MMSDSTLKGTMMVAGEALIIGEMTQCIKEAMDCLVDPLVDLTLVYPILGHPSMRPDESFVKLVRLL